MYCEKAIIEFQHKSSLSMFKLFKSDTFQSPYMKDISNFRGIQLKFKCRTNTLGINAISYKENHNCNMCPDELENNVHFILECPKYLHFRNIMFDYIKENCDSSAWQTFSSLNKYYKTVWLLSDHDSPTWDTAIKSYLISAWTLRNNDIK